MKRVAVLFLFFIVLALIPAANAAHDLTITQPSVNETKFAEMRDFYVYGIFQNSPLGIPGDVKIELFPTSSCNWSGTVTCSGSPLRQIQSHVDPVTGTTNKSCLDFSFVNGATVKGGYVPDIVINPDGTGLMDPNIKVVVTDRYYAGLVLGGVSKTYNTTYKDSTGKTLQDLTADHYTILVTGISRSLNGQVIAKNITFGVTDTAFGTNRPPDNKNARINYAIEHNLRTYFDAFPGYFSDGGSNWSNFVIRAYSNNGIESVNDLSGTLVDTIAISNNTMFMYNINSAGTTYAVELAPILKYNLQDSENTTFLYFSNGEPFLKYVDTTGTTHNVSSAITPFTGTQHLALTRVEVRSLSPSSLENLYDTNDAAQKTVYTDLSGGVTLNQGQEFMVFGVTKPIPSTVTATSYPYWYSIDNRISTITYTIKNSSGGTVLIGSHDVNLSRYFGSTTKYNSLFEFGSEFTTLTTPGTYQVSLIGNDVSGNTVQGTSASFSVRVLPPEANIGVFRNSNGVWYLSNGNGNLNKTLPFGKSGDTPVVGDWNKDGRTEIGVFRSSTGTWYLDYNGDGTVGKTVTFGRSNDTPVVGDWNKDGKTEIGVFRPSTGTWYLNYNFSSTVDKQVKFGMTGDKPVVGDFNTDGYTDIGVFRPSTCTWYATTSFSTTADKQAKFGKSTDTPVVGDWDVTGTTGIGVFRPSTGTWYLNDNFSSTVDHQAKFGKSTDTPVVGDWNKAGHTEIGVFRPSTGYWYLNYNFSTTADKEFRFGKTYDTPVVPKMNWAEQ